MEFIKEKNYTLKGMGLTTKQHDLTLNKFRLQKYSCFCVYTHVSNNRLAIYIGMTDGNVIILTIYKQANLFQKFDEISDLKAEEKDKHQGPIVKLVFTTIDEIPLIISGSIDGRLKLWQADPDLKEKDMNHYIRDIYTDRNSITDFFFYLTRNLLVVATADMTVKILNFVDKRNRVLEPIFELTSVIKYNNNFDGVKNKKEKTSIINSVSFNKEKPSFVNSLNYRESDFLELYTADNNGKVFTFRYMTKKEFEQSKKAASGSRLNTNLRTTRREKSKNHNIILTPKHNNNSISKDRSNIVLSSSKSKSKEKSKALSKSKVLTTKGKSVLKSEIQVRVIDLSKKEETKKVDETKDESVKYLFRYKNSVSLHKNNGIIKISLNSYDNLIYTAGYDNRIICYNTKTKAKIFDFLNKNTKTHFSCLLLNDEKKELILGDDIGNLVFINILSKNQLRYKLMPAKIIQLEFITIFKNQEHLLIITEDNITIYRINRKNKIENIQHHDAEIMKLFIREAVIKDEKVIEDAKIISCSYDNKIKIWDFMTMDILSIIEGPELSKKNIEISSVCYLQESRLIAVGTDLGYIFFWDLSKSEYLPLVINEKVRHKSVVTSIIGFNVYEKNNIDFNECALSCSMDGVILFYQVNKLEIKDQGKSKIEYDDDEVELMLKKMKKQKHFLNYVFSKDFNKDNDSKDIEFNRIMLAYRKKVDAKIFKCTPAIKKSIDTVKLFKEELKFNTIAFKKNKNPSHISTIFAGVNDYFIYIFDFDKEKFLTKIKGNNSFVTCMLIDGDNLLVGGIDGFIDVFKIRDGNEESLHFLDLMFTLKDPDINIHFSPKIHEIKKLNKVNLIVCCNNNKKIIIWNYMIQKIIYIYKFDSETTCLGAVETYGKLLCGTKLKMIMPIDLIEALDSVGFRHTYHQYPFTQNKINFESNELSKVVDNFKIMKSLTEEIDDLSEK